MISGHQHVPTFTGIDWAVGASAFIMPYGAKPMNIYSGKSHKEHLTVSLRSGTQLERYIYNNGFEPHNSRKHWIVKKDFLKKLAFEANRYLVFQANGLGFDVAHQDLKELFDKLPALLELDQQSFRMTNVRLW